MTRLKGGRQGQSRWLWLILLLLLLGVGGCFLVQRQGAALTLNQPAAGANISGPVTVSGTGKAGATVTISENGAALTTAQVGQDGMFSASVPAPSAGEHTYTVSESGTQTTLTRTVSASGPTADTAQTPPATPAAAGTLAITSPAADAAVPAGVLTLSGTGPANTSLTLSEDGNSVGQAQTDASGAWTFSVPSPTPGAHTYTASAGTETSQLALTVAAGTAQSAPCTKTFSLSLKDGQQVRGPFRFGGEGVGKSYTVTVLRGTRQIGQKVLPLDSTCGWSYTSNPGQGRVTYALRETGQSAVAGQITLNVTQ